MTETDQEEASESGVDDLEYAKKPMFSLGESRDQLVPRTVTGSLGLRRQIKNKRVLLPAWLGLLQGSS